MVGSLSFHEVTRAIPVVGSQVINFHKAERLLNHKQLTIEEGSYLRMIDLCITQL